jgi:hypothetical protein
VIPELDRYQGVVFRQLLVSAGTLNLGVVNLAGRVDAFHLEGAAFQIKHSSKRLSPWQFTYMPANMGELLKLRERFNPVWAILVCGVDGVVSLSLDELVSVTTCNEGKAGWVRVSRIRKGMYRVSGSLGELARAKQRGVEPFLEAVFSAQ